MSSILIFSPKVCVLIRGKERERARERSYICWFASQMAAISRSAAATLKPAVWSTVQVSIRCRSPRIWIISCCILAHTGSGTLAGNWTGSKTVVQHCQLNFLRYNTGPYSWSLIELIHCFIQIATVKSNSLGYINCRNVLLWLLFCGLQGCRFMSKT